MTKTIDDFTYMTSNTPIDLENWAKVARMHSRPNTVGKPTGGPLGLFFSGFNKVFDKTTSGYTRITRVVARKIFIGLVFMVVVTTGTAWLGKLVPGGFMPSEDMAISMRKITRSGCERIAHSACELAVRRRQHLTMVHKANVLRISDGLFKSVILEVAGQYPELQVDEMFIDAMAAALVRRPGDFDVIVTSNMYGDILSDLAAELSGGLGLGGALNAGDEHAVAQPTHGSAPDIAGRNQANPSGLLLSSAMLLGWLGGRHQIDALSQASEALENAIAQVLSNPAEHTADLGGNLSTGQFGDAVLAYL